MRLFADSSSSTAPCRVLIYDYLASVTTSLVVWLLVWLLVCFVMSVVVLLEIRFFV